MSEKNYKKKYELQQKMISHQSKQIDELKSQIEKLRLEIKEKDELINSIAFLREEFVQNVEEAKSYKKQYKALIEELRKMKKGINKEVYKGKWWLVKFLIK